MALNHNIQYDDEELEDVMVKSVAVPQCVYCVYSKGAICEYFNKNKNEVPVDIFNCPYFKSEKNEAGKMLGVDLNGSKTG